MTRTLRQVLLIDDHPADNFLHRRVLLKAGVADEVVVIEAADEALVRLRSGELRPDLIFLDLNMPRMNGFEFLEALEAEKLRGRIDAVIMMLTTSLNPADAERALALRVSGFLGKPLTYEGLAKVLTDHFHLDG